MIPTFNHAFYLGKALKSVLNQTFKNWEAIVIDNNSTDDTDKIISNINDTRIKYLKINNNGVIAKSRNLGVKFAKGDWIAFLDSDDWWTKDKLEVCFKNIDNNIDFIYHDLEIKSERLDFIKKKNKSRKLMKPILIDLLINMNPISNSSVIVRKKLLNKVGGISENRKLTASEDYHMWLKISKITDKFLYLPFTLGYYFVHKASMSNKDMSIPIRQAVSEFIPELNLKQKIKLEMNLNYISGRFNYLNSNYQLAKENLHKVFKKGSINLKFRSLFMLMCIVLKFKNNKNTD